MKAIFLDIDGVLNDHRAWPTGYSPILPDQVGHLNKILSAVPEAMIVLSSAWRYVFNTAGIVEALLGAFGVECIGRVHGVTSLDEVHDTPDVGDVATWSALGMAWRPQQIIDYVDKHGVSLFVVLDDLPLGFYGNPGHPVFVQTDPKTGLTDQDAHRAITVLRGTWRGH